MQVGPREMLALLLLALNSVTAAVAQDAASDSANVRYDTVSSGILGEDRLVRITLPEGYDDSGARYPVLYVLDAESDAHYNHAVGTVANAARDETTPEMIVVGIHNTNRNRDMIPAAVAHRPGSGGSEEFLRFFAEELVPHVDREYRTDSRNVLYGASNAGLFTVFAMLRKPDLFVAGIAASPMIGHSSDFMYRVANELGSGNRLVGRTLYMIYGENDSPRCKQFAPGFQDYLNTISPAGFRSELVVVPNEGHVPSVSLDNGLRYVFGGEGQPRR